MFNTDISVPGRCWKILLICTSARTRLSVLHCVYLANRRRYCPIVMSGTTRVWNAVIRFVSSGNVASSSLDTSCSVHVYERRWHLCLKRLWVRIAYIFEGELYLEYKQAHSTHYLYRYSFAWLHPSFAIHYKGEVFPENVSSCGRLTVSFNVFDPIHPDNLEITRGTTTSSYDPTHVDIEFLIKILCSRFSLCTGECARHSSTKSHALRSIPIPIQVDVTYPNRFKKYCCA